jgi:sigma-B regulation protein RsbU (phosphoserine phosphatase)
MLPKTFAPFALHPDIDIYASLTPAKEVGGDLYDYYIRDEKLFFCIGDVSGKGVPASLVMSEVRSLFRSFTMHETRLDRIMGLMNKAGSSNNEQLMFVTYFLGILDLPTGRLRYCNAGHDAPLIIDRDGARMLDVAPNLPLGVDVSMQYTAQETILDSESTLFLYTDGLTEAMDATHHQFTSDRMMEVASQIGKQGETRAQTIVQQMSEAVRSFVDVAQQSDDLAMLTISYVQPDNTCVLDDSITIVNDLKAMDRVTAWFESMTSRLNMPENAVQQLRLALEEAIVNVILYAYPAGTQGEIEVVAKASADRLQLRITDSGTAFDPTMRETADTNLDAEDRPIGGLGILLVRQNTDAVNYERVGNKNIFTLFKNL